MFFNSFNIIAHIKSHFPEKHTDELNDIVIASLAAAKRDLKHGATDRAKQHEAAFSNMIFERKKASLEARKDAL